MNKILFKSLLLFTLLHYSMIFSQSVSKTDSTDLQNIFKKDDFAPVNFIDLCDFVSNIPSTSWRTNFSPGEIFYTGLRGVSPSATNISFNGTSLNDPLTGRFNLHLFAPDLIGGINNYDQGNKFGTPNTLDFIPLTMITDRPYTRALYQSNTGIESSLGITFGQPLFTGFRYIAGFSSRTYNNMNDSNTNKYQNIFFSAHMDISKDWQADYTILNSKGDVYLNKSIVVPGDTAILNNPHQKNTSINHIVVIKNDSSKFRPKITLHRLSGSFEFKDNESDEKHLINDGSYDLSFEAKPSVLHIPLYLGVKYLYRDASVGDTVKISDSRVKGYLFTKFNFWKKSEILFKILPQFSENNKLYFGLWNQYRLNLKNNQLNIAATFSKLFRHPTLSEISGLTIYNTEPASSLFFNLSMLNNNFTRNKDLQPEAVSSADFSLNYNKESVLKSSLALFIKTTDNIILPELTQQGVQYTNKGEDQFSGIESFIKINILKHFGFISTNTLLLKTSLNTLSPANITGNFSIFVKYKLFRGDIKGILAMSARYWSSYYTYDWNYGNYLDLLTVPEGMILNAKALFTVMNYAHVILELSNINGIDPLISDIQYLPERSFRFGILWELFD